MLSGHEICKEVKSGNSADPESIAVVPNPDLKALELSGESSVTLRLGRWFLTFRQSSETHLETVPGTAVNENKISKSYFIPFGTVFVLHPGRFVLASTLEWIRVPRKYAAVVVGKSTLGRRGIVIETAAGVHPGFTGCLTLEVANVGEVPVRLTAGMPFCQLFFHSLEGKLSESKSSFSSQRKPRLGQLRDDLILSRLLKTRR